MPGFCWIPGKLRVNIVLLCNAGLSPVPCAEWYSWPREHLALLGEHQVVQIDPLHGGGVSCWLGLAPFALKRKGEASGKKSVSSHSDKVLSRTRQENSSEPSRGESKSVIKLKRSCARSEIWCLWSRRWRGQNRDDLESCKLENQRWGEIMHWPDIVWFWVRDLNTLQCLEY